MALTVRQCARLLMALLLGLLCGAAGAQQDLATVRLDGQPLLRLSARDNQSARSRADEVERRLQALASLRAAPPPVRVLAPVDAPDQRTLLVGSRSLLQVTPDDAVANGMDANALAQRWAGVLHAALQQAHARRQSPWGAFRTDVQAGLYRAFGRMLEAAGAVAPRLIAGAAVLLLFWGVATLLRRALRGLFRRFIADLTVENLIRQVAYYAVWALGLVLAVSAFGLEPSSVATALGLSSIAIGFALKDILSNFVSGMLILLLRPFKVGDQVVIGETEGTVQKIALRAVLVLTYDGRLVAVPSAETFTSRVTNNTASPLRRASVDLPVGYDVELRRAIAVASAAARDCPGVLPERPVAVCVRELRAQDVLLEIRFWADSRRSDFVAAGSEVRLHVIEALRAAAIPLPEPSLRIVHDDAAPQPAGPATPEPGLRPEGETQ